MIKIYVASDHAGIELKSRIVEVLSSGEYLRTCEVHDLGPQTKMSVDFPDYADLVCKKMHGFKLVDGDNTLLTEVGILICGSGQGMCMRANRYPQIRAALCWSVEVAHLAREHNDANIMCLGARTQSTEINLQILAEFLRTPFAGGRHQQRVAKITAPI